MQNTFWNWHITKLNKTLNFYIRASVIPYTLAVVKVDRRIRWHYTTTILRLRIGARLTRYWNCKFHNVARTISRHADGISRYSIPPSAGPLLPPARWYSDTVVWMTGRATKRPTKITLEKSYPTDMHYLWTNSPSSERWQRCISSMSLD